MPVMLLFRHGDALTLAVINRRLHKRDEARDVLEKITLIKDIRFASPHRAHVEILCDLSFDALYQKHGFDNFVALHQAWQKTLDSSELNKRFFQEIANWYFWALDYVRFPAGAPKQDGKDHISVIRLITRLMFCWFVKEKGLIPDALFDLRKLPQTLNCFAPDDSRDKNSVFYRAILQNLFFATLNTEMDKRGWTKEEQNFMAHSLYRFRESFQKPNEALDLFKNIPFLNGGLFECLDKDLGEKANPRYLRVDGFSRRPDSQPVVPDFLFFGAEREVDLSEYYGDTKFKRAKVRGLIHTFDQYKFTVTENTPIEEEIALDPELSGKVFENLLAAYNPETGATARKQTGSFFTPREIVNYMVDEALIAYLKSKIEADAPSAKDVEPRVRHLFAYNAEPHRFTSQEVDLLIAAIDQLKSLDPAVGSGAFPMGILHKLVFILGKLDPRNEKWKERQVNRVRDAMTAAERIEDATIRGRTTHDLEQQIASVNEAFERNELDYGRKLYLIENCIYGVDIQAIAVQIAKMRFFVSLIVDQKTDPKAPNLGVRPLPNLETKFVAANTLIGVERQDTQFELGRDSPETIREIDRCKEQMARIRHEHFIAKTPRTKEKCRADDARLRARMADLLSKGGYSQKHATRLAAWDPYDQNAAAAFFDSEWMFAIRGGFDICIGNPPWVSLIGKHGIEDNRNGKDVYMALYDGNTYMPNLYEFFLQRGLSLLRSSGFLVYILPDRFAFNESFARLRRKILDANTILQIVYKWKFQSIIADTMTLLIRRGISDVDEILIKSRPEDDFIGVSRKHTLSTGECVFKGFKNLSTKALVQKIQECSKPLQLVAKSTSGFGGKSALITAERVNSRQVPVLKGASIQRYAIVGDYYFDFRPENLSGRTREIRKLGIKEKVLLRKTGDRIIAAFDDSAKYPEQSLYFLYDVAPGVDPKFLLGLLNSNLLRWFYINYLVTNLDSTPQLKNCDLDVMPIIVPKDQKLIIGLVERILSAKRRNQNADTSTVEREIDQQVYALYGLTPEEIKFVEATSK